MPLAVEQRRIRHLGRLTIGVALLLAGVVLALCGLLLLIYQGEDGGGDTYITLSGNRVDAHLVGGIVLPIALAVTAFALGLLLRRRRDPL
jgi:hypothetical protein